MAKKKETVKKDRVKSSTLIKKCTKCNGKPELAERTRHGFKFTYCTDCMLVASYEKV